MTQATVFYTSNPQFLSNLFSFTGNEFKAIRIEPYSQEENTSRLIALDGHCMGVFYDSSFYTWEPVNIYIDKDMEKELKKGQEAWVIQDEEGNFTLTIKTKKAKNSFDLKCNRNEEYPEVDSILKYKHDTQPITTVALPTDGLFKFKFTTRDTLQFYFTGQDRPVYVKNTSYEETFEGILMPIQIEEPVEWTEE